MEGKKMELKLEHTAIVEAVQMWVDKYYTTPAPKVTSVEQEGGKGSYAKEKFMIEMEVRNETVDAAAPDPNV